MRLVNSPSCIAVVLITASQFSSPAITQDSQGGIPTDKEFNVYTPGGVNIYDNQFRFYTTDISVGSNDSTSKLSYVRETGQYPRQNYASYVTSNFNLSAKCVPCSPNTSGQYRTLTVKAFDGTHTFEAPYAAWGTPTTWTNDYLDGAQVIDNGDTLEYRSKDGDQLFFAATYASGAGMGCGGYCRVPVYAVMANGESIVFNYATPQSTNFPGSILTSVVNSKGYGLAFAYLNPSITTGDAAQRYLITSVTAFHNGCLANVVNCSAGTFGTVSYTWTTIGTNLTGGPNYRLSSFTNLQGRVLNYVYGDVDTGYRMTSASFGDDPNTKLFQNTYAPSKIGVGPNYPLTEGEVTQQIDAFGQVTLFYNTYRYDQPRNKPVNTVTTPDQTVTTYTFKSGGPNGTIGLPTIVQKNVSPSVALTQTYAYDTNARFTGVTDPEGNSTAYTLDNRGNRTVTTISPKTSSSATALTESASFPACDANNFRTCNKPSYTVDARGARTDYSYDPLHGQPTVVLMPANASNVREVIRKQYSTFYPGPGMIAPAGTTLVSAYLLTANDECLSSSVTGTTVDFTYVCPTSSRIRTTYSYTPSTSTARSNYELEGRIDDADAAALRTCYRYDKVGNVIAETKPRASLSSCS